MRDRLFAVVMGLCLWLVLLYGQPAISLVHEYPEGPGKMMVRSLQTLRDRQDQAWQLALFKRINSGQMESVHLRLVGFPGGAEVQHPAPLRIASRDRGWTATDVLSPDGQFPSNVGEYDVMRMMSELGNSASLELVLPLKSGDVELVVPPFVLKEWRQLVK